MQKICREAVYLDENSEEVILYSVETEYPDISFAISALETYRKADRAMYRLAIKQRPDVYCDNWYDDVSYGFCVNDVTIRAYIIDAEKTALDAFGL